MIKIATITRLVMMITMTLMIIMVNCSNTTSKAFTKIQRKDKNILDKDYDRNRIKQEKKYNVAE